MSDTTADRVHEHTPCPVHDRCLRCEGCDECERWAENDAEITRRSRELARHLANARISLGHAEREMAALMSNSVYDVEYAETALGDDAKYEIEAAHRAVRNAGRIADLRARMLEG